MNFETVKTGFSALSSGEIAPIVRFLSSNTFCDPDFTYLEVVDQIKQCPDWLSTNCNTNMSQSSNNDQEYYFILGNEAELINISGHEAFEELDPRIYTYGESCEIDFKCECITDDGEGLFQEFSIQNTRHPKYIPATLLFQKPVTEVEIEIDFSGQFKKESQSFSLYDRIDDRQYQSRPDIGLPVPRYKTDAIPIFFNHC